MTSASRTGATGSSTSVNRVSARRVSDSRNDAAPTAVQAFTPAAAIAMRQIAIA
jgi:hypothetical protein